MTTPVPAGRRRRVLLMLAPIVGGLAAFGLALAGLVALFSAPGEEQSATVVSAPTASESFAPATEVQRVHDAMHAIAARCEPGVAAGTDAQRELDRDVDVILAFARRFPDVRLEIDDESGRTLSLLLGVRDDLLRCAPAVAARLDPMVPPQYRGPASGAPS